MASRAAEPERRQDRHEQVVVPIAVVHLGKVGPELPVILLGESHVHPEAEPVRQVILARKAEIQPCGALDAVVCQVMEVLRMDIVAGSSEESHAPLRPQGAWKEQDHGCDQAKSVFHSFESST